MAAKIAKTAIETHRERMEDIRVLMARLKDELKRHDKDAKAHPQNWGYAGSTGHVREVLVEAVAFIGGVDTGVLEQNLRERRG